MEEACDEAVRLRSPVVIGPDGRSRQLRWSVAAKPVGLGSIDREVLLPGGPDGAVLALPYDRAAVAHLDESTIRMFRFDDTARRYRIVRSSERHPRLPVVLGPADPNTRHGLIGRPVDARIRTAIELLCGLHRSPAQARVALRDRICDQILCEPGLAGADPAPLPEGVCERCHGLDLDDLLDCELAGLLEVEPACPPPRWESLGPDTISGAIRQLVIDPNDGRRLYAVSANGGLWCLDDVERYPTTSVWRPLTDRLGHLRFRDLAVARGDRNVLYATNVLKRLEIRPSATPTTEPLAAATTVEVHSQVWRSRDAGSTWLPIHRPGLGVVHRLAVDPRDPNRMLAATSTGLWEWMAAGAWRRRSELPHTDLAFDPGDPDVVYAATSAAAPDPGVYRSINRGRSWVDRFIPAAADDRHVGRVALGIRNPDRTFQTAATRTVVARYGQKVRIRNAAEVALAVSDASPATVLAFGGEGGNDSAAFLGGGSRNRSDIDPAISQEWVNCLAVDPFDATRILVGGVGLFAVRAGSGDWQLLRVDPPHEDYHAIAFDPRIESLVYVANDGGVFSSVDGGDTWPTMAAADIVGGGPGQRRNLAKGLVTAEFRSAVVDGPRVAGAIDHTGLILGGTAPDNWALWSRQGNSGRTTGGHESGLLRGCPASDDRFYMVRRPARDKPIMLFVTSVTVTSGVVDPVDPLEISGAEIHLATFESPMYLPDDQIYLAHRPAPVAVRRLGAADERLFVFGAPASHAAGLRLRTFRLTGNEVPNDDDTLPVVITDVFAHPAAFVDLTFQPGDPDRFFALAADGSLIEADVADLAGTAAVADRWEFPAVDRFPSRLAAARGHRTVLYAISQHAVARWRDGRRWQTRAVWPDPDESLLSLVVHPDEPDLLFVGTSRGVHLSEDAGLSWRTLGIGLPRVPVIELAFHDGMLRAATYGRGLWQCRPVAG